MPHAAHYAIAAAAADTLMPLFRLMPPDIAASPRHAPTPCLYTALPDAFSLDAPYGCRHMPLRCRCAVATF